MVNIVGSLDSDESVAVRKSEDDTKSMENDYVKPARYNKETDKLTY